MDSDQLDQPKEQEPQVEMTSLSSISVESADQLPHLFDFPAKLKWMLDLQFVRFRTPKHKQQFLSAVKSVYNLRYLEVMFWYLLLVKLPIIAFNKKPNRQLLVDGLKEDLHELLSKHYVQLFMSIPPPKERPANMLLFFNVFFCIKMYSETFRQDQMEILLTPRFMLDCFHVIVFETLGMEVSDRYIIQRNLNEMFADFFENVMGEEFKKRRSKEAALQKQRKLKADKQTDFFEGKIARTTPSTMEEAVFLKELQDFMAGELKFDKKRSNSMLQKSIAMRKESRSSLLGNTKSSFNTNNELKRAQLAVMKKQRIQEDMKLAEENRKAQFINQMENIQTSRSSQSLALKSSNSKEVLSLVRVGPCVSSYLNLQVNKVPGSKVKYINHSEEKVVTNDYLRKLLQQAARPAQEPVEQVPEIQTQECDLSKPMKGMTLMDISSYRVVSERQRNRQLQPKISELPSILETANPQKGDLKDIKLPRINLKSVRYRRPQVITEESESKRQDIFLNPGIPTSQPEIPDGYRVAPYRNNLNLYKRNYRP